MTDQKRLFTVEWGHYVHEDDSMFPYIDGHRTIYATSYSNAVESVTGQMRHMPEWITMWMRTYLEKGLYKREIL